MERLTASERWLYFKLGSLSFGGPAGQIALMHRYFVEERRWFTERQFTDALSFCMVLPGPEALQLAIYLGTLRFGARGGLWAGLGFLLPGALMTFGLASVFVLGGQLPVITAMLTGLKVLAVALIISTLLKLARKTLTYPFAILWAVVSMGLLTVAGLSYPLLLIITGLVATVIPAKSVGDTAERITSPVPDWRNRSVWAPLLIGLCVTSVLTVAIYGQNGTGLLWRIHVFFSQVAWAGFGGAYAVVAWVQSTLSTTGAELLPSDWLTGLALTETTPGPLMLVVPFYGFLAIYRQSHHILTAWIAGMIFCVSVFLPSFVLVISLAKPFAQLGQAPWLAKILNAITAAAIAVIAVFALHLAQSVCWSTTQQVFNYYSVAGVGAALIAIMRFRVTLPPLIVLALVIPLLAKWYESGFTF
jgi:chromate transporter